MSDRPVLTSSLARVLLAQSPLHAWTASPALNPEYQPEEAEKFDLGTACHAHLLEGASAFVIIEAEDWRTKDARAQRDAGRAAGRVPLLASQWADVQAMAKAARAQLAAHEPPIPFTAGKPEQTLTWEEAGVPCRARLDFLHTDYRTIDDLKSTAGSANPAVWSRTLFGAGYDVQAAFYVRAVKAVHGIEPEFRFITIENYPPFALSVIGLSPEAMALAQKKVGRALALWRECLATGRWPAYPARTCWADLPPWEEARWLEREYLSRPADDGTRDIAEVL